MPSDMSRPRLSDLDPTSAIVNADGRIAHGAAKCSSSSSEPVRFIGPDARSALSRSTLLCEERSSPVIELGGVCKPLGAVTRLRDFIFRSEFMLSIDLRRVNSDIFSTLMLSESPSSLAVATEPSYERRRSISLSSKHATSAWCSLRARTATWLKMSTVAPITTYAQFAGTSSSPSQTLATTMVSFSNFSVMQSRKLRKTRTLPRAGLSRGAMTVHGPSCATRRTAGSALRSSADSA
mmetsp:Transcript_14709/g.39386  ORF Transcript_14709/g.39386 Transcript_14709/m.39386 type:complete len:237 (-) Transcript_14709:167-877(-)